MSVRKHGRKHAVSLLLPQQHLDLLERVQQTSPKGVTRNDLITRAIEHTYQDPVLTLKEEKRSCVLRMREIDIRIASIEQKRKNDNV